MVTKATNENNAHRYENARKLLLEAASYDPTSYSSDVHTELAKALRGTKSYSEAIAEGQKALSFDPSNFNAAYDIAASYGDLEEFEKGLKFLQNFAQNTKSEVQKFNATQWISEFKDQRAYKLYSKAHDLLFKKDNNEKAIEYFKKAAALDPSDCTQSIHAELAGAYERTGQPEQAIIEAQIALDLQADDKYSLYIMGSSYHDIGYFDDAVTWFRKYVALEPDKEERDRAIEFINDILDDKKELGVASNSLPDYLDQMRKADEVEQWQRSAIPLNVFIPSTSTTKGYRPSFRNYILKALDTWCLASGKKIDYQLVNDKNKADITVNWTTDTLPFSRKNSDRKRRAAGVTGNKRSSGNTLSRANIEIRSVDYWTNEPISEGEAFCVSMHEVGHALGLGHSNNVCDVMYVNRSTKTKTMPTARDSATLARLYQSYPTLAFKPKAPEHSTPDDLNPASLRPPSFMPPAIKKVNPPLFTPPPLKSARKLVPPTFTPPPLFGGKVPPDNNGKLKPPPFIPPPFTQRPKTPKSSEE
jgi:FOG: TPR repeat